MIPLCQVPWCVFAVGAVVVTVVVIGVIVIVVIVVVVDSVVTIFHRMKINPYEKCCKCGKIYFCKSITKLLILRTGFLKDTGARRYFQIC